MSSLYYMTDEDKWNQHYVLADTIRDGIEAYERKTGFLPSNVQALDMEFIDFINAEQITEGGDTDDSIGQDDEENHDPHRLAWPRR